MSKLKMVGEYYVNLDNIAYLKKWNNGDEDKGTIITYNCYAAAAMPSNWSFEPLQIFIYGITPTEVADFLNDKTRF